MGAKTGLPPALKKFINSRKKKKKPANPNLRAGPKKPSRKMFTPEQMKELEKTHREAIKKGKKPKSNMPMLKRGGRAK